MNTRLALGAALLSVVLLACGDDSDDEHEHASSNIPCDSSLTYEKDVAPIVASKCLSCHSTSLARTARAGAPSDHNFDNEALLKENLDHVEYEAVITSDMPPGSPLSAAQKQALGGWIACQ